MARQYSVNLYIITCPKGHVTRILAGYEPLFKNCDQCGSVCVDNRTPSKKMYGLVAPLGSPVIFDSDDILEALHNYTWLTANYDATKRGTEIYTDSIHEYVDHYVHSDLYVPIYNGNLGRRVYIRKTPRLPAGGENEWIVEVYKKNYNIEIANIIHIGSTV